MEYYLEELCVEERIIECMEDRCNLCLKKVNTVALEFCEECEEAVCRSCVVNCVVCDTMLCEGCAYICKSCGEHVCPDCVIHESENNQTVLCEECHEGIGEAEE